MLQWFRTRASRIAATLVVSFAAMGSSFVSEHPDDCHDAGCAAIFVEHDADAHGLRAPGTGGDSHPLHCLVCHWARSFRPHTESRIVGTPVVQTGTPVHVEPLTFSPAAPAAQPPLRSPPPSPVVA